MDELSSGSQVADPSVERRKGLPGSVEQLSHLETAAFDSADADRYGSNDRLLVDSGPGLSAGPQDAPGSDQRRHELDLALLQLYAATDQIRGAEAERAAALGRIAEVEYHLHLREVEVASLREELDAARTEASSLRLLAARRARETLKRSLGGK